MDQLLDKLWLTIFVIIEFLSMGWFSFLKNIIINLKKVFRLLC